MDVIDFLQYLKRGNLYRKYILIAPSKEMLTKKGTVRNRWLHAFFGKEDKSEFTLPQAGGCLEEGIIIHMPNNDIYYLISYNKDFDGWRTFILEMAAYRNTFYAEIKDEKILLSNGMEFPVIDCIIDDNNFIPQISKLPGSVQYGSTS